MKKVLCATIAFALMFCTVLSSLAEKNETEFIGPIIASAEYISSDELSDILSAGDYVTFSNGMAAIFIGYPDDLGLDINGDFPVFVGRDDEGNAELYVLAGTDTTETSIKAGWLYINVLQSSMVWWSDRTK